MIQLAHVANVFARGDPFERGERQIGLDQARNRAEHASACIDDPGENCCRSAGSGIDLHPNSTRCLRTRGVITRGLPRSDFAIQFERELRMLCRRLVEVSGGGARIERDPAEDHEQADTHNA